MERTHRSDKTAAWHGARIKMLREKRLLTMQGLCDEIESASSCTITVTPGAISRWENGLRRVALRYRRPLADALGTDHQLLFEEPPAGWKPLPKTRGGVAA